MRFLYAFIFLIGSFTLSSYSYAEAKEADMFLPDILWTSINTHSERCGDILIEGWALWEGEVCLGFSYTFSSDNCRTIVIEGVTPPGGLLGPDRKVNVEYFEPKEDQRME